MNINVETAMIAALMLAAVGWGYFPLLFARLPRWTVFVVAGVILLATAIFLRSMYWDFTQHLMGDGWVAVRDSLGGQNVSAVFNVIVILACYALLHARWLLIPKRDRDRRGWITGWHWWNAWLHPWEACAAWRRLVRRDKR